ncbi:MAG: threonine--tRNA ligase [Candidatus Ryanbacteria bacterium CG10_big_fil_rev_8_21_14_0_10_43_42]|uniref:Threonine--tRNA ligase n=1 Tax=Candidatus Ryanbacteria bacterium CG10_big_fil_rev_8_21_14_0_10_43_42 TaxID=1974864 RepID=A0A2M8KWW7_9BACT|nr:MAG: threonine--tRNA ligase [Candidatus Ryanbacteria bacterium CG10_big_fil_rev_8_21_14_0_10_43_42]
MTQNKKSNTNIEHIRHSLAHILATAVLEKYPKAELGIGPAIDTGFYYDIKFSKPISEDELPAIEKRMREIINENLPFSSEKITPQKARSLFKNQPFKLDLIKEFTKDKKDLTAYTTGNFVDLCKGGHVKNTKEINPDAFKLLKLAGAYWRGDEKNPQLTRIYGVAFSTVKELEDHLMLLEEAVRRDHRKLGRELGLFVFSDIVGPGLPLYTPKGAGILRRIKNFSHALRTEIGYEEVQTPQINKDKLFMNSGHYEKFKDDMFHVSSNYSKEAYFLKPMNCPQHTQIYASEIRSYKDLPVRYADFSLLYRDEKPGELSGLTRLRSFSQDDGHAFLREDQVEQEFKNVLTSINTAMKRYGLSYYIRLSLRDEKNKEGYLGTDAVWKKSQATLKKLLKNNAIDFVTAEGEAAFYGPKMDLIVKDALAREWQISTIQIDFNQPERFNLEYIDEKGKKRRPVMVHSAITGSPERFFGLLIEHYAGAFPFWLAPVQVKVLSINDKVHDYAHTVMQKLVEHNIRVELDTRNESIGKKIREGEKEKIPYLLIIGEKEKDAETVSVREHGNKDGGVQKIDALLKKFEHIL